MTRNPFSPRFQQLHVGFVPSPFNNASSTSSANNNSNNFEQYPTANASIFTLLNGHQFGGNSTTNQSLNTAAGPEGWSGHLLMLSGDGAQPQQQHDAQRGGHQQLPPAGVDLLLGHSARQQQQHIQVILMLAILFLILEFEPFSKFGHILFEFEPFRPFSPSWTPPCSSSCCPRSPPASHCRPLRRPTRCANSLNSSNSSNSS